MSIAASRALPPNSTSTRRIVSSLSGTRGTAPGVARQRAEVLRPAQWAPRRRAASDGPPSLRVCEAFDERGGRWVEERRGQKDDHLVADRAAAGTAMGGGDGHGAASGFAGKARARAAELGRQEVIE